MDRVAAKVAQRTPMPVTTDEFVNEAFRVKRQRDDLLQRLIMSQEALHHAMATARGDLLADLQTQFAANRAAIVRAEE